MKICYLFISLLLLSPLNSHAAPSPALLKKRMEQRLASILPLKQSAIIGENNQGYLTARTPLNPAQKKLIAEENADRLAIYTIIAKKTHTSVQKIGKARSATLFKTSPKGFWVQHPQGQWIKK